MFIGLHWFYCFVHLFLLIQPFCTGPLKWTQHFAVHTAIYIACTGKKKQTTEIQKHFRHYFLSIPIKGVFTNEYTVLKTVDGERYLKAYFTLSISYSISAEPVELSTMSRTNKLGIDLKKDSYISIAYATFHHFA